MDRGSWFLVRLGLALVLIGVAGVATACSGRATRPGLCPELPQQTTSAPPVPGAPSAAAATSASLEGVVAQLTLDELQHLREKITLGTWKTLHGTDTLELYSSKLGSYSNENWCARMVSEKPLDSDRKVK